jgi:hypothetical protein
MGGFSARFGPELVCFHTIVSHFHTTVSPGSFGGSNCEARADGKCRDDSGEGLREGEHVYLPSVCVCCQSVVLCNR